MKLILTPGMILAEPIFESILSGIIMPESAVSTQIALVRQTTYRDVSVGDRILHAPKAGLGIRSNIGRFVLLNAGDILARLE